MGEGGGDGGAGGAGGEGGESGGVGGGEGVGGGGRGAQPGANTPNAAQVAGQSTAIVSVSSTPAGGCQLMANVAAKLDIS